nr:sensor histidine kinase [Tessaracoccus sp. OS52]
MRWARTPLRSGDRRLLEAVGRQLGEALHAAALVEELRRAQERLVSAREEERKRLRRDLHDGLGPSLAALGLEVDSLRNRIPSLPAARADAELVALRSGIQSTVAEVRRVVEGLRPPALDELGLGGAVTQLARRLTGTPSETAGAHGEAVPQVTVQVGELPALPAATEVAAFRISQEALTNVVRHAMARRVWLGVNVEEGDLVVRVQDDGNGQVASRDGGVGLVGMRERAEEVGGDVAVEAHPGLGTTITARLPLPSLHQVPAPERSSS